MSQNEYLSHIHAALGIPAAIQHLSKARILCFCKTGNAGMAMALGKS
ncbi:MAG: hypothetical protein ACYYK0_06890 [Candidatus Eutrophobiaceae bacterium]